MHSQLTNELSQRSGLTNQEAQRLQQKFGYNQVKAKTDSVWTILLRQLRSPLVYLLFAAALISFGVDSTQDGLTIGFILILNTTLGFIQEYRSSQLLGSLQTYISSKVQVIREGKRQEIDKKDVVPGDTILLQLGDIVPADCKILEENELELDESSLTGESELIHKTVESSSENPNLNILYAGSHVTHGTAVAQVTAIGKESAFGKITSLTLQTPKPSQFEQNMQQLSFGFLWVGIIFLIVILILHVVLGHGQNFSQLLLFILSVTITIVPEALPVITTLTLAHRATRLSKLGMVVRHQTAIEDLGNVDILCSDKTGTLTKNEPVIQEIATPKTLRSDSANTLTLLQAARNLAYGSQDVLDLGVISYTEKHSELNTPSETWKDIPFDPTHKYSGRIFGDQVIIKGAPETIFTASNLGISQQHIIYDIIQDRANRGWRALSYARITKHSVSDSNDSSQKVVPLAQDMEYLGTIFFADELKEDAFLAIQKIKKEKLDLKIITGDSLAVAIYIGSQAGLIQDSKQAIEASKLDFNNSESLAEQTMKYTIFARATPTQKFQIIQSLQKTNIVGYLGDGINDAPSLKLAQVGIVVDTASDIAKETADIVLLRKNLLVIAESVFEGRRAFENINKYVKHSLIGNFGNFFTIGLISLLIPYPPMLPLQILISNLITDLPDLAFATDNVDPSDIRKPKHHSLTRLLLATIVLGCLSSIFDFIYFALYQNWPPAILQTGWFVFSILTELSINFSIRSKKPIWKSVKPTRLLYGMSLMAFVITIFFALKGFQLWHIQTLELTAIVPLVLLAFTYLVVTEITKIILYKRYKHLED